MIFTAAIFGLVGYGILQQQGQEIHDSKQNYIPEDVVNSLNDRQGLLFDMKRGWDRAKELGAWPWGHQYKAPTTEIWEVLSMPKNAELVDWDSPMDWTMRQEGKRRNFVANYKEAYSTELAHAFQSSQLVYGVWHETITKGPIAQQTSRSDGIYDPTGFNLYEYSAA